MYSAQCTHIRNDVPLNARDAHKWIWNKLLLWRLSSLVALSHGYVYAHAKWAIVAIRTYIQWNTAWNEQHNVGKAFCIWSKVNCKRINLIIHRSVHEWTKFMEFNSKRFLFDFFFSQKVFGLFVNVHPVEHIILYAWIIDPIANLQRREKKTQR